MDKRLMLAASAAILIAACAKKAEDAAAAPEPAADSAAAEPAAPELMAEEVTEAARPAPIGSATVTIGLDPTKGNAPYFASAGAGFCNPGGGCAGGIAKDTGDVDLSGFPPGDVTVTVTLGDDAYNAGYRFPSQPFQAIGIATWKAGTAEPPDFLPLFGANAWPRTEFQPPAVTSDLRSVTFLDEESAEDAYDYAVALDGPSGRVILDPTITNGGKNK
jgi:hypothetical protein